MSHEFARKRNLAAPVDQRITRGKEKLHELWSVLLSLVRRSRDKSQVQQKGFYASFSPMSAPRDCPQWSDVLVCSFLAVQPQNLCLLLLFPHILSSLTFCSGSVLAYLVHPKVYHSLLIFLLSLCSPSSVSPPLDFDKPPHLVLMQHLP